MPLPLREIDTPLGTITIDGDGDDARAVVDWTDDGEGLRQGNVSRLKAGWPNAIR